ncbi:MAG TPA: FHA domain-containing protein [Polyangia bacterium]|nr:FHA domain-containing protein [Polyangia bacterium]
MKRLLPLLLLTLLAPLALASHTHVRLERIVPTDDGKLLVYASVVELEGNLAEDHAAPQFTLKVNGKAMGRAEKWAPFRAAGEPLDVVLIVETSALYGPQIIKEAPPPPPTVKGGKKGKAPKNVKPAKAAKAPKGLPSAPAPVLSNDQPLDKVKDATKQLLDAMPGKSRVLLIDYGGEVTPHPPFRPAQSVGDAVDELGPDNESGDLALVGAVKQALIELNKPRTDGVDARKLIVVISDGLNSQMDHKTFRMLGDTAAKAHVPIHTIAFSPTDARGPLLNLGEISKRSHGTFRWARNADDLHAQMETLADEMNKQYVLTFKVSLDHLERQRFVLTCEDLESNELIYGEPPPGSNRGHGWGFWLILAAVALAVGGTVLVIATRPKKRFATRRAPGAQPQTQQPQYQQPQYQQPQPQYQQPQPQYQQPQAQASSRGMIIMVSGALAGQRFSIDARAPFSIGKGPANLQISDDPTVSTRHAEIAWRNMWVLTDLNSTNGTFVNNQRVTQPVRLSDGDLVRFGNTQIKFRTE